jgi:hypothetical protein
MTPEEEFAEAGYSDFRVFLRAVWNHLRLPRPTPVQNDIASALMSPVERLIIEAFRGVGKSFITVAFVLWFLRMNPQRKVMVTSASQKDADSFSIFAKQLIAEMDILAELRPPVRPRAGFRDSNQLWDVGPARPDRSPSVKSVGITGQLTGSRADLIIPDDVEITKNAFSQVLRERNAELVKEFDAVLKPGGLIRYLGTPQTEQSLYNKLIGRGYSMLVWPSEIPDNPAEYQGRLGPLIQKMLERGDPAGTPVEPTRFDHGELDVRRLSYGRSGYALQFMLSTKLSDLDRHPLKAKDLLITDLDSEMAHVKYVWGQDKPLALECAGFDGDRYNAPVWVSDEMAKYTGTVMAIDPSGKGKDETAYAVVRYLYGNLFLVASGGFRDGYAEETLLQLAAIAAQHRITDLVLEENYGGGMFKQLLMPKMIAAVDALKAKAAARGEALKAGTPLPAEDVWHSKQKELFICDTLEPIVQSHRLIVDRRVIEKDLQQCHGEEEGSEQYSLIWQMTHMHRERKALSHEDRLEALAMACQFYQDLMDRDADKMHAKHNSKLQDAELKRFKQSVFLTARNMIGGTPAPKVRVFQNLPPRG